MTLEQIILLFNDIADRHKQINKFIVSEDYNLGEIDDNDFPLLAVVPTNPNLPKDVNGFSMFTMDLEIKLLDLVNDDLDNKIHVYSDSIEILKDIVNEFATHPYYHDLGVDIISDASMEKLDGFTDLDLYGYGTELTIASPNKISFCGSPITNLTGYDFSAPFVTVNDGLNTIELYPSDTYTCINAGGCDDATVNNSDLTYSETVTSGDTLVLPDITHTDSDGSNISTPAQTPFICTTFTDVVVTDNENPSSPISLGSGDTYTCETPTVNEWFEMEIDTTIPGVGGNNEFQMQSLRRCTIDKGDGSDYIHTSAAGSAELLTYSTGGVYTVRLKGYSFAAFDFRNGDPAKITKITNWGSLFMAGSYSLAFDNCDNMVITATDPFSFVATSASQFLRNKTLITGAGLENANTARLTSVANMFQSTSLDADLGGWDLRNCTNFDLFAVNVTTWSQDNYSATLMGWLRWDSVTHAPEVGWEMSTNESFNGGNSTVAIGSEAALARTYLISTLGWTITDGGEV